MQFKNFLFSLKKVYYLLNNSTFNTIIENNNNKHFDEHLKSINSYQGFIAESMKIIETIKKECNKALLEIIKHKYENLKKYNEIVTKVGSLNNSHISDTTTLGEFQNTFNTEIPLNLNVTKLDLFIEKYKKIDDFSIMSLQTFNVVNNFFMYQLKLKGISLKMIDKVNELIKIYKDLVNETTVVNGIKKCLEDFKKLVGEHLLNVVNSGVIISEYQKNYFFQNICNLLTKPEFKSIYGIESTVSVSNDDNIIDLNKLTTINIAEFDVTKLFEYYKIIKKLFEGITKDYNSIKFLELSLGLLLSKLNPAKDNVESLDFTEDYQVSN